MVVAHAATGRSLPVAHYFPALQARLEAASSARRAASAVPGAAAVAGADSAAPHGDVEAVELEGRCVALRDADAEYGLDNGYNLLETSTRPFRRSEGGLLVLAESVHRGLLNVFASLEADEACVLNASQHPDCPRDQGWYERVRVPRPIYRELVGHRGWRHWEGIDAKAQNGANVQVSVAGAVRALNLMIGLSAVHVALFANSPLESGKETGWRETRLTVWERVFHGCRFPGDAMLAGWPPRPFVDLGDYFRWMFRPGTVTRSLPMGRRHDYKSAPTVLLEGDPSLSAFLVSRSWPGRRTDTGEAVVLVPHTAHFEHSQIAQFMDARLRYRLATLPELGVLMAAWRRPGGLEALFEEHGAQVYIEGRCPGAGFADEALMEEAGESVASAMVMGPAALQWGLLQRPEDALRIAARHGWAALRDLRRRAQRQALRDPAVARLCAEVLEVARDGLAPEERHLLAYADYVCETGRTAADRMLETWRAHAAAAPAARLAALARRHRALPLARAYS